MDPPLELPPLLATRPTPQTPGVFDIDPLTGSAPGCPDFEGLIVLPEFLSPEEAGSLLRQIDASPFALAQSGKQKQHYGAKVNFNKHRLNATAFKGLPAYTAPLEARLREAFLEFGELSTEATIRRDEALSNYETTDLFVLRYHEREASNLDLHVDDTFAYGEAIFDVSLETDSVMTFIRSAKNAAGSTEVQCVRAPLAAGSAALLFGRARFEWEHGILYYDVKDRRTSITLRTLSSDLAATPDGSRVLEIARNEIV
jgi:alkylated DNA repair protein alkB family protein 4